MAIDAIWDYFDPKEWRDRTAASSFPPVMIAVAITGAEASKDMNPNLPVTIEEQIEAAYEAYQAGAISVHIHARNQKDTSKPVPDKDVLNKINEGIRKRCPGMIVNNSTGVGLGYTEKEKLQCLYADSKPDMASLNPCAMMFPPSKASANEENIMPITYGDVRRAATAMKETGVKPEIEIFYNQNWRVVEWLIHQGLLEKPYVVQLVTGSPMSCLPSIQSIFSMGDEAPKGSIIFLPGIGSYQLPANALAIIMGLHVRVGMEDNLHYRRGELAKSSGQLVERVVRIANELNRPVATIAQAREMLGLAE